MKLIPYKLPEGHIFRPRLIDQLSEGITHRPLTLLSAPAGSGKSVLVASWAGASAPEWPIAWLKADRSDNQPEAFWTYALEALDRCGVSPPNASRREVVDETFFAWLCADLVDRRDPVVLILDDADRLTSPKVLEGLDFLLTHAASHFRLIMCCRADPVLPLNRYRLAESMADIRASDLSFSVHETEMLLKSHQMPVTIDFAAGLTARTGGWAAGLRLAVMALQRSPDGERLLSALDLSDANIADYLMTEVLDAQTPELRSVLLRTSVADELWPDLVDELVGHLGGAQNLNAFGHANMFVDETVGATGSRRVHPLLREMLQAQLAYESPDLFSELHKRCAGWLLDTGQVPAAVDHAITSGDYPFAAEILIDELAVASIIAGRDTSVCATAVESMPATVPGINAALIRAAIAVADGDAVASGRHLARFEDGAECASDATRLSAAIVRATLCSEIGDFNGAFSACGEVDALLTSPLEKAHPEVLALLHACRGTAQLWQGDVESAEQTLTKAAELAAACGATFLRLQSIGRLALLCALQGRLTRAEELGHAAQRLAVQSGLSPQRHPPAAALALAWSFAQQYHEAPARRWLVLAEECSIAWERQVLAPVAAVLRARLASRAEAAGTVELGPPLDPPIHPVRWMSELVAVQVADVHLAHGRPDLAREAVADFLQPSSPRILLSLNRIQAAEANRTITPPPPEELDKPGIPLDVRIDALLVHCASYLHHGQEESAVQAVEHALRLAAPEQFRRPFVLSAPPIRDLMRRRVSDKATDWLQRTPSAVVPRLAPSHVQAKPDPIVLPVHLSARETEVLSQLAEMLSTEEIGMALFVSVNTVRTHIRSILRKLNASGRSEAVRRAWELGLISRTG